MRESEKEFGQKSIRKKHWYYKDQINLT